MKTVQVIAPAKVNLFLAIGQRRDDGYHDVTTVMHALTLHDRLSMTTRSSDEVAADCQGLPTQQVVTCAEGFKITAGSSKALVNEAAAESSAAPGVCVHARMTWCEGITPIDVDDKDNLACKAVTALAHTLGRTTSETITIDIEKHIPSQAGLGGGSSDAAAALVGAAYLWGLSSHDKAVETVARSLGADVRFFLHGGCVLLAGKGERFVHTLAPRHDSVLLVQPACGVSTPAAYGEFDRSPSYVAKELLDQARIAQDAHDVPLFNNLARPAEKLAPGLERLWNMLRQSSGVEQVLLSGSGSSTFAVCKDDQTARILASDLSALGYWTRATSFSSAHAAPLPKRAY
jgi:4-diphosphocytidyl-2-C-methyl-D-erythritol kinase